MSALITPAGLRTSTWQFVCHLNCGRIHYTNKACIEFPGLQFSDAFDHKTRKTTRTYFVEGDAREFSDLLEAARAWNDLRRKKNRIGAGVNVALRPQREGLRLLSLCTGGGGLDLGVELCLGHVRICAYVEREAFAVARLVSAIEDGLLAPGPVFSDVRSFNGRPWRGLVDGLIGGIPCQPYSMAGRKFGRLDDRDLWSTTRRLIAQCRPGFVLIENVDGMLVAGADEIAGAERVRRDLRKLGYAIEGGLFTAEEVGAPHKRQRVFILGVADAERDRRRQGAASICGRKSQLTVRLDELAHNPEPRHQGRGSHHPAGAQQPPAERDCSPLADAKDCDRLRGERGEKERTAAERASATSHGLADPDLVQLCGVAPAGQQLRRQPDDGLGDWPVFPPGPGDRAAWGAILAERPDLAPATAQSGVRRMADGLAARVDQLRMLGNGVVPLEAALALRTLAHRLARRGSAGATELVRLMGDA